MSAAHTGTCPGCGRAVGFQSNGLLARHNHPWNRGKRCAGSGGAAREHMAAVVRRAQTPASRRLAKEMFG